MKQLIKSFRKVHLTTKSLHMTETKKPDLWHEKYQLSQIYHFGWNTTYISRVLQVNRKELGTHHRFRDYSARDLLLHLHQTGRMFDDKEDPRQTQLQNEDIS